ncbi:hypothetical protein SDC9_176194 [bioreactor metagenome]|uniref:DUF1980 domain-containing protein n=1 Tax=bioreactor metagenome TaxID=1076179 RepID=A0A645GSF5_9ZZZZ
MKIECVGMVFKSDQYTNEEFAAARLMMVCCAADMVPVGFMCSYAQASELKTDSWKKVTGIIDQKQCDGNIVPYVKVLTVEDAEKPDNEYIYPY